jgi:hypothetical protein
MPGEVGALARICVAVTPVGHVVLTQGDVILHNGQGPRSIVDAKARRWLFDSISTSRFLRSFLVVNQARQEVWVCFPEANQDFASKALVWCWANNSLTTRQLPTSTSGCTGVITIGGTTFDTLSGTFDALTGTFADLEPPVPLESFLFIAGSGSKIYKMDTSSSADGSSFTAVIERTGLHLEDPQTVKVCRGAWLKIDASVGVEIQVQIGASMDAETAPTWSAVRTYTVGTDNKIDAFATGRYLAYRVTTTGTSPWRLRSIDLDIELQGKF